MTAICRVCEKATPLVNGVIAFHQSAKTTKGACAGSDLMPRS